jgi:exonuclease VII small subunit
METELEFEDHLVAIETIVCRMEQGDMQLSEGD